MFTHVFLCMVASVSVDWRGAGVHETRWDALCVQMSRVNAIIAPPLVFIDQMDLYLQS